MSSLKKISDFKEVHSQKMVEKLTCCFCESTSETVSNIVRDFSISETEKLLAYLIDFHKLAPDLLLLFWQQKSDSCPLESELEEQQEIDFKRFVKHKIQGF